MPPPVKTESEVTHDYLRSAYCLQWAIVLAYSKILNELQRKRPFPVALVRRLLDVYTVYTAGDLVGIENGQRADYDPTGGFRRARPAAIALRASIEHWDGVLPAPPDAVTAARGMASAYGHAAAGQWDEHTVPDDAWEQLLWPDGEGPDGGKPTTAAV